MTKKNTQITRFSINTTLITLNLICLPTSEDLGDEADVAGQFFNLVEAGDDGDWHKLVRVHLRLQVLVVRQVLSEQNQTN